MNTQRNIQPIFILGVHRSGTTLLNLMLDCHSRIAIPYESYFFIDYYKNKNSFGDLQSIDNRITLVKSILSERYVQQWDQNISADDIDIDECVSLEKTINQIYTVYAKCFDKDIWGDKTPLYIEHIDIINKMFPTARFVHIIRDGRDVALSTVQQYWGANDFVSAIKHWERTLVTARKMLHMLPRERYIELKFENLVLNPSKEIKKITDFLEVNFEEAMTHSYMNKAANKVGDRITKHHKHLTSSPSESQAFKWKKNLKSVDQAIAHEIAGPILAELGYPEGCTTHPYKTLRKAYHRIREAYKWRFGN